MECRRGNGRAARVKSGRVIWLFWWNTHQIYFGEEPTQNYSGETLARTFLVKPLPECFDETLARIILVWIQDEIETSFHLFLSQLVQRHMSSYSDWRGLKWVLIWYSSTGSAYKCGRTARCHIFLVSYRSGSVFLSNWRSFEACKIVVNMDFMLVHVQSVYNTKE